ncbi:hypothetical protein PSACC_02684 [Paramicrosporidium saccamoebae]|uniref:Uncharacterized protein n=1 Tax=Paramicrosporidium saccamoebae TaxID=1246581 RepID=A0A2H9TIE3_9FUNG|nr:hypothetical protein PSACC_02684 [Paramicrosporidium saccamoebae]
MRLLTLLSFTSLVYASGHSFQNTTSQDYFVESLVSDWEMRIQYVILSIWLSLPEEYRERVGPLDITVEEPKGEPLTSKDVDLPLFYAAYEKQRAILKPHVIFTPCNFLVFSYYRSVLIEKTATTKAELRVVRQSAMGILQSISAIVNSLS